MRLMITGDRFQLSTAGAGPSWLFQGAGGVTATGTDDDLTVPGTALFTHMDCFNDAIAMR
jgi:hypothetical protein